MPIRSTVYAKNFLPALQTIRGDLLNWNKGNFCWFGRAAILKMNVLPRLLYLLQAIPIKLPQAFFTSFKTICRSFLWAGRPARLSWDRLVLPKQKGGIGLPDLFQCYRACQFTRIVDCHVHRKSKGWVEVEEAFSGIPVSHLPWITPQSIPKPCEPPTDWTFFVQF